MSNGNILRTQTVFICSEKYIETPGFLRHIRQEMHLVCQVPQLVNNKNDIQSSYFVNIMFKFSTLFYKDVTYLLIHIQNS